MLAKVSTLATLSWSEPFSEPDLSNLSALELWNLKPCQEAANSSGNNQDDSQDAVAATAKGDDIEASLVNTACTESHVELSDLRAQASPQECMRASVQTDSVIADHVFAAQQPAVSPGRSHAGGMGSLDRELFNPFASLRIDTLVPASALSAPIRQKLSSMPSAKAIFLQHRSRPSATAIEPRHDSNAAPLVIELPPPEPEPVLTSTTSLSILALSSRSVFAASANRDAKLPPPPMPVRQGTSASHQNAPHGGTDRPLLVSSASHPDGMRPFLSIPCISAHRGGTTSLSGCSPVISDSSDSTRKSSGPRIPYRILSTMASSERKQFANRNRR